jgi:hypothetical protein
LAVACVFANLLVFLGGLLDLLNARWSLIFLAA